MKRKNSSETSRTMAEFIIKGTILGLCLFSVARWIYWTGYQHGASWAKDFIFDKLKEKNEKVSK